MPESCRFIIGRKPQNPSPRFCKVSAKLLRSGKKGSPFPAALGDGRHLLPVRRRAAAEKGSRLFRACGRETLRGFFVMAGFGRRGLSLNAKTPVHSHLENVRGFFVGISGRFACMYENATMAPGAKTQFVRTRRSSGRGAV